VEVSNPLTVRVDGTTATLIGMASYRQEDGQCYYWWDTSEGTSHGGDQIVHYLSNVLGNRWFAIHVLCGTASGLALCMFMYSTLYCCSSHVRGVRLFFGAFMWLIALLQAVGVSMLYPSQWCEDQGGCSIGRSSIWGMVAASCFFLAGFFFLLMSNHPGTTALRELEALREEKESTNAEDPETVLATNMTEDTARPAAEDVEDQSVENENENENETENENENEVVEEEEIYEDEPSESLSLNDDESSLEAPVEIGDVEEGSISGGNDNANDGKEGETTEQPMVPNGDSDPAEGNDPDETDLVRDPSGTLPASG